MPVTGCLVLRIRSNEVVENKTQPTRQNVTEFEPLMKKLGKFKTGKSCLYIKRLSDVDETVLQRLIAGSVKRMRKKYPAGQGR